MDLHKLSINKEKVQNDLARLRRQHLKPKLEIKKSSLSKSEEGNEWLKNQFEGLELEANCVNKYLKTEVSGDAYNFKELLGECNQLEQQMKVEVAKVSVNSDEINVNELASYMDNLLNIPKRMSHHAEMMYQ